MGIVSPCTTGVLPGVWAYALDPWLLNSNINNVRVAANAENNGLQKIVPFVLMVVMFKSR